VKPFVEQVAQSRSTAVALREHRRSPKGSIRSVRARGERAPGIEDVSVRAEVDIQLGYELGSEAALQTDAELAAEPVVGRPRRPFPVTLHAQHANASLSHLTTRLIDHCWSDDVLRLWKQWPRARMVPFAAGRDADRSTKPVRRSAEVRPARQGPIQMARGSPVVARASQVPQAKQVPQVPQVPQRTVILATDGTSAAGRRAAPSTSPSRRTSTSEHANNHLNRT